MDVSDHRILATEKAFDGRIVKVYLDDVQLPDGRTVKWERVQHPGAVGIVPLLDGGDVLMVRQYRNAVRGVLLEIPAGKLDREEEPRVCAERELTEETGHRAGQLIKLAEFYNSPGYSDEVFHLFLAKELREEKGSPGEDEFLEVVRLKLEEAPEMIAGGEIRDAKSIIGISLTAMYLKGSAPAFRSSSST